MLALPAIAKIPNTDRIQRIKNTPAISRNGEGSIPISQRITPKMIRSHKVILRPASAIRGVWRDATGPYPMNQRNNNNKRITTNIYTFFAITNKICYKMSNN
jgi:hypothetical protein